MNTSKVNQGKVIKMSKILTTKPEFDGTPDKIIPRKENLTKGNKIEFNIFDGWVDIPIYKALDEIDPKDLKP